MRERSNHAFQLFNTAANEWVDLRVAAAGNDLALTFRNVPSTLTPTLVAAGPVADRGEPSSALATAMAHLPDEVFTYGSDGRLTFANQRLLARWGLSWHEASGRRPSALPYPPLLGAAIERLLQQVLATGRPARDEQSGAGPHPSAERHETLAHPIFDAQGAVTGVAGSTRVRPRGGPGVQPPHHHFADVLCAIAEELFIAEDRRTSLASVFKRVARALRMEIHLHEASEPNGALRCVASGGLTSDQVAELARLRDSDAHARSWLSQGSPHVIDNMTQAEDQITRGVREIGLRVYVCCALRADGRLLGTITFASAARDHVTEDEIRFVQAASDLVAASMDRARMVAELRSSRDLAEQASRAKDNFLAALSHELRTPLNPVLLLASSGAVNPALPPAVRADFDLIARNVTLETRLIDDLLDLTRITHGKLSLVKRTLDLNQILQDALGTVKAEIQDKAIDLAVELALTAAPIRGDAVRLQQVFWNLLKNAVKFTPQRGRIAVRGRVLAETKQYRVEISDSGIGLTAEEAARVFESFVQGSHADNGSSPFGGLGLGLAITRKLVSLHGGRVEVASNGRDLGACFAVELPLADPGEPDDDQIPAAAVTAAPSHRPQRPGIRILLVEDHQPTRQALLQLLVHRHYEVIGAATVQEARLIATRKRFDIVISDIGLPDGSGYELMAALRRDYSLSGIALTGYGTEEDLALARTAGFVAHLTKPVRIQSLEAALMAAVPTSA